MLNDVSCFRLFCSHLHPLLGALMPPRRNPASFEWAWPVKMSTATTTAFGLP